jgi:hypothetical protein
MLGVMTHNSYYRELWWWWRWWWIESWNRQRPLTSNISPEIQMPGQYDNSHSFIHPRIHQSILSFLLTSTHYLFLYFRLFPLFRIYLFATNSPSAIHILFLKIGIRSFRNISFRADIKHSLEKDYIKRNTRRPFFFELLMLKFRFRFKKCLFVKGYFTLPFSMYLPTVKKFPIRAVVTNWHRSYICRSIHKPT